MTVTRSLEQLTDETDAENNSEIVTAEYTPDEIEKLVALLAQAYVAVPLFP